MSLQNCRNMRAQLAGPTAAAGALFNLKVNCTMRIAYLINRYPAVSHSFIRREILAVEGQGHTVCRIALRGWDEQLPDPQDQAERSRTRYVLKDGAIPLLGALLSFLVTHPVRLFRALHLVWKLSRRAERPFPVHIVYLLEACRIVRWMRAMQVTHLHAHFGTNPATVAMLAWELGGPPWSFTVHGPEEFDKPQFIALAEKIRCCAFVVAISSFGRSQLCRLVPHTIWPKIKIVHCGLDRNFLEQPSSPPPIHARLVCVGRLSEQKGQLLLIEASRLLRDRGVVFDLVLAGDGDMRTEIETLVAQSALDEQVHITGWISETDVRDEILKARALVLPSFAEGLPVVIMEALALRRPVISTYVAGIPELVQPGLSGWLVPAGDQQALAAAMEDCLKASPEQLEQMGEIGRNRVIRLHSADSEAANLIELFNCHQRCIRSFKFG
jgi:colanic acid/amylovoran biosynthesis glycosyltransferase